ncbi:NAD(P)/FAD-dependent oxidoreductase [Rhodococcus opacus]|uniref:NAD(P)/FAD-dependent oxidoreductase n=1 Tax=Rhodococcus opacus TaxID=37919 RepID=UPI0024732704|nr:FAD/NAD(P)-binding oxidoreductase [Rhodococcus opacus]MDH6293241.1 3-phenylpropionate/trans-cinnamate dioxygenase ferredoxin reductase subunit [Rhodococcus opacus]
MENERVVIVGAGEAGIGAALALRALGFSGSVRLFGKESEDPYHRPPLSKAFLDGTETEDGMRSARAEDFTALDLSVSLSTPVISIDRERRTVSTAAEEVEYDHLILATGADNRRMPGSDIDGVLGLRTIADARLLREALSTRRRLVIIGAGFLGLEVASVAADRGLEVEVVEAAQTPMGGKVSSSTTQAIEHYLRSRGISFSLGSGVAEFLQEDGILTGVRLADGRVIETDSLLSSIGVVPNVELAREAGLTVDNGIVVDDRLRSVDDPRISVIGDVASFPGGGGRLRVESVANALDQAFSVANRLIGQDAPYRSVPWFWSIYGPHRLELVGIAVDIDEVIVHGDPLNYDYAAYCFHDGELVRFESLNRPREHMKMRRAFERGPLPSPSDISEPGYSLTDWKLAPTS